jgi:hypothetical protein
VAVLHDEVARRRGPPVPDVERGAERRAVVAGRGLNEDIGEAGARADLPVRDAVHPAPAGETEIRLAACALHVVQDPHRGVFEHALKRGGNRLVLAVHRFVGMPRGTQ